MSLLSSRIDEGADADDVLRTQVEESLRRLVAGAVAVPCWLASSVAAKTATAFGVGKTVIDLALQGVAGDGPESPDTGTDHAPLAPQDDPDRCAEPGDEPVRRPADEANSGETAPAATDLPIAEYESLAASQVVARLERLTPAELRLVAAFEAAHRGRRTVLGKIDQLTDER